MPVIKVNTKPPRGGFLLLLLKSTKGQFMSFFKHVHLHDYDITDKGIFQACYDEMQMDHRYKFLSESELQTLANAKREEFKDYMRPLFQ